MTETDYNKKQKAFFHKLRREYRENLKRVGLSPDEHLDDLNFDYFPFYMDKKPIRFLKTIQEFYGTLDPLEQLIFKKEYLETGRHGAYWWCYYFKKDDFKKVVSLIGSRFIDQCGGVINGAVYKA